jgi:hypothetical protein
MRHVPDRAPLRRQRRVGARTHEPVMNLRV